MPSCPSIYHVFCFCDKCIGISSIVRQLFHAKCTQQDCSLSAESKMKPDIHAQRQEIK